MSKFIKRQTHTATLTGDETPALQVWYTGTAAATFVWNATKFQFLEDASLDTSVNTGGTTDGEITDAEAATLGAVVALINADTDGHWHARLVAADTGADTTDLLAVTSSAVTANGIASGGGAVKGCVAWDHTDLGAAIFCGCIGPEMDDSLNMAARCSASGLRNRRRDINDDDVAEVGAVIDTTARIYQITATLGDAGPTGPCKLLVYSLAQGDTLASGTLVATLPTFTNDTEATVTYEPPADLRSDYGERLVVLATDGASFDNLTVQIVGAYGDPGELASSF